MRNFIKLLFSKKKSFKCMHCGDRSKQKCILEIPILYKCDECLNYCVGVGVKDKYGYASYNQQIDPWMSL